MTNTQTISKDGNLPYFFTEKNQHFIQNEISKQISTFYSNQRVVVPLDNIYGVMIHIHEHWGARTKTLTEINDVIINELTQDFKNHISSQRTSNYYLNNEYSLMTNQKSLSTYRMNPRSREVQFNKTF